MAAQIYALPAGLLFLAVGWSFAHHHGFAALCNFAAGALLAVGAFSAIGVY